MGFYGNIADTSRIHFQFDKIFSSRYAMDSAADAGMDGIFSGRFVLVSYDPDGTCADSGLATGFKRTKNSSDDRYTFSITSDGDESYYKLATFTPVNNPTSNNWQSYYFSDTVGNYYKLSSQSYFNSNHTYYTANQTNPVYLNQIIKSRNVVDGSIVEEYWKCTGKINSNSRALFTLMIPQYSLSDHLTNYLLDKQAYGLGENNSNNNIFDIRGYDGTVWQKVYSGGYGKFILIAHLTTSLPRITMQSDVPKLFPTAPYIADFDGSNLQINVPSHWGFKIKESRPVEVQQDNGDIILTYPYSDQKISQQYQTFENNEITGTETRTIDADIYFNKKANNKDYNYTETSIQNEILITPSGASGKVYGVDSSGNELVQDTYEISVHLPMIGNLIAEGYDMLYGVHAEANDDGGFSRYTDVEFYPASVSEDTKIYGNSALGGKTHDLTTIAGSLNTIHDIMGQILYPLDAFPSDNQVKQLSPDYIYTYDNYFYRKGYGITKTIIQDSEYTYEQQTNVTAADFDNNKYFKNSNGRKVWAHEYESGLGASGYYLRKVNGIRYSPITLIQYQQSRYFTKRGEDYIRDNKQNEPTYDDRIYYDVVTDAGRIFDGEYKRDGSYYIKDGNNYIPSYDETPDVGTTYYGVSKARTFSNQIYYHPGAFYIKDTNDKFILAEESSISAYPAGTVFYILLFSNIPEYGYGANGSVVQYYSVINNPDLPEYQIYQFSPTPSGVNINNLYTQLDDGRYIKYSDIQYLPTTYTNNTEVVNRNPYTIPRDYYTLNVTPYEPGTLYLPGVYYIQNSSGDLEKTYDSLDNLHNQGYITFYLIESATPLEHPFYRSNTYYYENPVGSDHFDPDPNSNMTNGRQYYEKSSIYVESDETQTCPHGYEWSEQVGYVPPSLTLYTITKKPALVQMPGLGHDTNCLYGLLLYLNKIYGAGEEESRDMDTVRGLYNKLTDLLYQIKTLKPGTVLTVNTFGQIDSFEAGANKVFMTTAKGNLTAVSLSELKTLLNNA